MLREIVQKSAKKRLSREFRTRLAALTTTWDAQTFRQAAETACLPEEVIPGHLRQGLVARQIQQALKLFTDEEFLTLLADASPEHAQVLRDYPVWTSVFITGLRRLYKAEVTPA